MNWGTLISAVIGATFGAGTTTLVDRFRWKREHGTREHEVKREIYGKYVAALSLATHQLSDLRRPSALTADELMREAGRVLTASGAYLLRAQVLITAPEHLEEPTEMAFAALRDLRDRFDEPDVRKDPEWDAKISSITKAIEALRRATRHDLAATLQHDPPRRRLQQSKDTSPAPRRHSGGY
jgi:hypothetical protein